MGHWIPFGHPYYPPQPHLYPDVAYGCMPHPACLVPSHPSSAYAYGSTPMVMQPITHVWVPYKLMPEAALYPHPGSYSQPQQAPNFGRQLPQREPQRPPSGRPISEHAPEHEAMQMAWPESPLTAQANAQLQGRSAGWATQAAAHERRLPSTNSPGHQHVSDPRHAQAATLSSQLAQAHISSRAASAAQAHTASDSFGISVMHHMPHYRSHSPQSAASAQTTSSANDQTFYTHSTGSSLEHRVSVGSGNDQATADGNSAWQWLTEALLKEVMSQLPQHCRKRCRLVCKRWRSTMDLHIQVLFHTCLVCSCIADISAQ